jgi:integrase
VIDKTKNGEPIAWTLDSGTAESLRRWRELCPSDEWVFPAEAVERSKPCRRGQPMTVGHLSDVLRNGLRDAGVKRPQLYERTEHRIPLRAHDLRATFVTLALANGKTEDWVTRRTGHKTSQMVARYRRTAETHAELGLGWLLPLHEAIPELAKLDRADDQGTQAHAVPPE